MFKKAAKQPEQLLYIKAVQLFEWLFWTTTFENLSTSLTFWQTSATSCPRNIIFETVWEKAAKHVVLDSCFWKPLWNAFMVVWGGVVGSLANLSFHVLVFVVPGRYVITLWQNQIRVHGGTFIGGVRNQATEKRTKMTTTRRQPLRQPSPRRSTNAQKKTPSSSSSS